MLSKWSLVARMAAVVAVLVGEGSCKPVRPANYWITPNATQLQQIGMQAGGPLPAAPKIKLSAMAMSELSVIAANENFEVAFFTSLLHNLTTNVPGYTDSEVHKKHRVMEVIRHVIAQEKLHATAANAILEGANATQITPCNYTFPTTNFTEAITAASLVTDMIVGYLQQVAQTFAVDGGAEAAVMVPLVASILGQEGEQAGGYRMLLDEVPSAAPFLTSSTAAFVINHINQQFTVKGSCGTELETISMPIFETLSVVNSLATGPGSMTFTTSAVGVNASTDYITYISGVGQPFVVPIWDVVTQQNSTTFSASMPWNSSFTDGLQIIAMTQGKGPFVNASAVANATIAGPALMDAEWPQTARAKRHHVA